MCGIAGILGSDNSRAISEMLNSQRHRGPGGNRTWTSPDGRFALGSNRLAVGDGEGGGQPFSNEDGSVWMVLDGRIYNHEALRQELGSRHIFRTLTDAEVVLHLYEEEGPDCIRRLDGMFAVAIWDRSGRLLLARDPLGIKPLYYGFDREGHLRFASEIKALVETVPEIHELPNGSYWVPGSEPVRYYQVPEPVMELGNENEAVDLLEQALLRSVRRQLKGDLPMGVFLSGGLDSSLIAAMVRREVKGELHSFAVGVEGSADLRNARLVAKALGTRHHERVLTRKDVLDVLPKVVDHLESCDPALVRSSIATYFVSEMAARYVKVAFSGEGADELFGGYQYLAEFDSDPAALATELFEITCEMHNTNLQRIDRMTMVHGLEARVPFLDLSLLDLAFRMKPSLKRRGGEGKWVLRKVAERYLASEIVWRKKEKFAIGSGIGPLLEQYARSVAGSNAAGRHPEESLYWSLFKDRYGRKDILSGMGRSRSLNPDQRWVSGL